MVKKQLQPDNKKNKNTYQFLLVGFLLCVTAILLAVFIIIFNKLPVNIHQIDKSDDNSNQTLPSDELIYSSDYLLYKNEKFYNPILNFPTNNQSHPVAVMIDNHFEVWDTQFGLSQARIVYHTLVEGGATRFMAIFDVNNAQSTKIGPVRSVRSYFLPLALEYDALLAHVGGSPEALAEIEDLDINNLNEMTAYGPLYFSRDDVNYIAPHSTFTSVIDLQQALIDSNLINSDNVPISHFQSTAELPLDNDSNQKITIDYSAGRTYDVAYTWNNITQSYLCYRFGEVQRDAETASVILINNLIIQYVPAEQVLDDKLRLAMDVVGEGQAVFFHNGQALPATWTKTDLVTPTQYFDLAGQEIIFDPGNIWIEIVPEGHEVEY